MRRLTATPTVRAPRALSVTNIQARPTTRASKMALGIATINKNHPNKNPGISSATRITAKTSQTIGLLESAIRMRYHMLGGVPVAAIGASMGLADWLSSKLPTVEAPGPCENAADGPGWFDCPHLGQVVTLSSLISWQRSHIHMASS